MALPDDAQSVTAPRSEMADRYREQTATRRIETRATYVRDLGSLDLTSEPSRTSLRQTYDREPMFSGGTGMIILFAALLALLLLWLRFGGTGTLLTRAPKDSDGRGKTVPAAWKIDADEAATDQQSLMDQLRAMPDRRAALVRLLRHALLAAGTACDTRFARSDTEREAFARLPGGWRYRATLAELLKAAELAHYGGRDVSEEGFEAALAQGAAILQQARPGQRGSRDV
ncbi:hypothetical protein ACM25N_00325 [Roseovarius sp. C7]|uniref:hypothetical protein n=1 Tax=Roseovarius sp. C7 TaxID=3398643 RepID=UPI0039F585C3